MHHLHQQTHVAQQSIRKKLRVPSAPAASPQSDDSAGSATALEVRQLESDAQQADHPDQFELSSISLRGYNGISQHTNMNDIVPLQKGHIMTSEQYNFPTGAELFVAPASKGNNYVSASSGDLPSVSPPLLGAFLSGQGQALNSGAFSNQTSSLSKTACWNTFHAQLGQYNMNPPTITANSPQGVPAITSSNPLQYSVDGTFFVGTNTQTGSYGNNNKDLLMASFFPGANAQADAMQLFLMNSGYNAYPDASTEANMVLLGPSTGITVQEGHLYNDGQSHQPFIGNPCPPSALSTTSLSPRSSLTSIADPTITHPGISTTFPTTRTNNAHNSWKNGSEFLCTASGEAAVHMKMLSNLGTSSLNSDHLSMQEISDSGIKQTGLIYTPSDSHGPLHIGRSNRCDIESTNAGAVTYSQSLNLSLSSQRPSATQLHNFDLQLQPNIHRTGTIAQLEAGDSNISVVAGSFNFLSSNKYLKAAQQLLNEVCNVGRERRNIACRSEHSHFPAGPNSSDMLSTSRESSALQDHSPNKDGARLGQAVPSASVNDCREPTTSLSVEERQECEVKKSKLVNMLQEVDKRYRQYHDQMQVLIGSFDSIVGVGAATPYTALALQAMSRYFRCLRDAIFGQIQIVCKALGEEGIGKHITSTGNMSRLRFVDQQLRQQRAFQQLGMLQQHAWRPQRGLPERSVSILRAWLFEHFLHPYPKDADKMMLARQAGLTRSQVSNWFINARVRLWKPMVEEMYQEEAKDLEVETDVRLTDEVHDSMNFEEGNAEASARRKHCKVESNLDHNYTNLLQTEGATEQQNFLEGNVLASGFLPTNILSMRKQVPGTMRDISDAHLLEDGQKERLGFVQNKKSRVNSHDPDILLSNMPMEVDMKYDDTSSNAIDETDQKFSMASRNGTEQYSFSFNGSIHADVACFGAYDQHNNNRYEVDAGFDSRCPGNSVSLTLGLRHCDNLSGDQQAYFHGTQNATVRSRENANSNNHEYSDLYEASGKLNSDQTNDPRSSNYHSRKHIESHLLHDFVIS